MNKKDKNEILELFTQGFNEVIKPAFEVLQEDIDGVKKDVGVLKKDVGVLKKDVGEIKEILEDHSMTLDRINRKVIAMEDRQDRDDKRIGVIEAAVF